MSHAEGQCRFPDGTVKFFEYNGTGNWCLRRLRDTREELVEHWRTDANAEAECTCGQEVPVVLAHNYAYGHYYPGRACLGCMAITHDPLAPWADDVTVDEKDGQPDWWIEPKPIPAD